MEKQNVGPNKQAGWEITYDMSKYRVGEKSKNDNRVYSFIWHLKSMYCGLIDAKIRASDKDLPVKFFVHHLIC